MSLLLKNMWRSVLRGSSYNKTFNTRNMTNSVSEVRPPDPVLSCLKGASGTDEVLAAVQAHLPRMTRTHMLHALRTLFEIQKANQHPEDPEALIADPTFDLLCQNFKKHARDLDVSEAIEAVKVLSYLKAPCNSNIVQTLLQILRCNINMLNVRQIMFLDFILTKFDEKNHLVDALKLALPLAFQIHLPLELDKEDLPLLKDMLAYCCAHDLPDRCINNVVTGLLLHDQNINAQTAKSIIWSLCQVNCTEEKFPTRVQLLHICYDILSMKLNSLNYDEVLRTTAKIKGRILEKHPEYYHEQLMDSVAEYVIKSNVEFEKGLLVARVLSRIAHTHLGLVEHLCAQAVLTPGTLQNARTNTLFGFINCLANNNYTPEPQQWNEIRRQISANPVLDCKCSALPWTKVCLELASLGHYEDKLLDKVFSEEYLSEFLSREPSVLDLIQLVTLCEAVRAFHSARYCLPAGVGARARQALPPHRLAHTLHHHLATGLGGPMYVAKNVQLPNGFVVDFVTCLKGGYPLKLERVFTAPQDVRIPLEELNIPEDALTVCILNFNQGCFSMNSNRLRGTFRLVLDILQQQGYVPVAVNLTEWSRAPAHDRTPYLLREIGYKCAEVGVRLSTASCENTK